MSSLEKTWSDLQERLTDNQVIDYWDDRNSNIIENIKKIEPNDKLDIKISIIHRIAKSLNDKEKYSSVWYLFKEGFLAIEPNLVYKSNILNEAKFELARGLHHNRKYDYSKRLFNELASSNFDTTRFEDWWDQTAFASSRERLWIKTSVFPSLVRLIIIATYVYIVTLTKEFVISTTIFIILYELLESWTYLHKTSSYLKEFQDIPEVSAIKKRIKKKLLIELGISFLFYILYFLKQEWMVPLALIIAIFLLIFNYGINYYYLPSLIARLNRDKALKISNII
jgi:hypothetical protein